MKSGVSSVASLFFELFLIKVLRINKVLLSLIQETKQKNRIMDKKQNNEIVKINELRLGNSVFIDGEFADVNELIFKLILNKKIVANPIGISEDLLIDIGFKRKGSLWSHDKLDLKLYYCNEYKSYESEQLPMYVKLKHLHQLQNFYFMFKGVELKFHNVQ